MAAAAAGSAAAEEEEEGSGVAAGAVADLVAGWAAVEAGMAAAEEKAEKAEKAATVATAAAGDLVVELAPSTRAEDHCLKCRSAPTQQEQSPCQRTSCYEA